MKQTKLNLFKGKRGGRRPGAGRRRIHSKGVAHREREFVVGRTPVHINFKYRAYIRNKTCLKLLKRAIVNARTHGLRIIQFSLQSNHIHLIIEAESNEILTRGMRSLTVTFAKGLKKGKVQIERYHLHVLRSIRETRNAIHYVLFNQQKHGRLSRSCESRHTGHPDHKKGTYSRVDEFSSLLSLPKALEMIREFAKKNRITLEIGTRNFIELDRGKSYFLGAI